MKSFTTKDFNVIPSENLKESFTLSKFKLNVEYSPCCNFEPGKEYIVIASAINDKTKRALSFVISDFVFETQMLNEWTNVDKSKIQNTNLWMDLSTKHHDRVVVFVSRKKHYLPTVENPFTVSSRKAPAPTYSEEPQSALWRQYKKFTLKVKETRETRTYKNLELDLVIKKNGEEVGEVYDIMPETLSCDFCLKDTSTYGKTKVIGAGCPVDPETNSDVKLCLNWRRTDRVGNLCAGLLSSEKKTESLLNFCSTNLFAEECRCINRAYNADYIREKKNNKTHDYCWFGPCSDGFYQKIEEEYTCGDNLSCNVSISGVADGDVKVLNNDVECKIHNDGNVGSITRSVEPTTITKISQEPAPPTHSPKERPTKFTKQALALCAIVIVLVTTFSKNKKR